MIFVVESATGAVLLLTRHASGVDPSRNVVGSGVKPVSERVGSASGVPEPGSWGTNTTPCAGTFSVSVPPGAASTTALRGGKSTEKFGMSCQVRVTRNGK